jgi:hypothetical protein
MHNISTIYRFNTPFLDLENEKKGLLWVIKKIEKSIEFDGIEFEKISEKQDKYFKVSFIFKCNQNDFKLENYQKKNKKQTHLPIYNCNMWKIEIFYISEVWNNIYHLPIFKLNIFLNDSFLINNESKEKAEIFK